MATIRTNNHIREGKYYPYNMSKHEQKQVESAYGGLIELQDAEFVFYKDYPYFMDDCTRIFGTQEFKGWDGYFSDTFFSCILVRYAYDEFGDFLGYIFGYAFS